MKDVLRNFLRMESAGGILLMLTAAIAIVIANTPLASYYALFLDVPVEVRIGNFAIAKPLLLWINDGLMALFFFLVGLELKREILEGELSSAENIVLPAVAAVGGIVVPVGIFVVFNAGDPEGMRGWAIPAATDIAFALGILGLLGRRVPLSLKVFLVSLAIFDDIGAIVIIAIFYTADLSLQALAVSLVCLAILFILSRRKVTAISSYVVVGIVMWVAVLKSGVHATLAGVALAAFIPMRDANVADRSPLRELEHDLHPIVAFAVLPIFAFANAGVSFAGVGLSELLHPVPLGIAAGLFVGKQAGVFLASAAAIKLGLATLPKGASWGGLYGVALLSGVGFTMSLFIGGLAFESGEMDINVIFDERLGIIVGSVLSGIAGYVVLNWSLPRSDAAQT